MCLDKKKNMTSKLILFFAIGIFLIFGMFSHFTLRWWNSYRKFACKVGWHSYPYFGISTKPKDSTGFLVFAKCEWCGYEGQIDSQGNLF